MAECIYFTIPFGDTTDPTIIAAGIASELNFQSWMVRQVRDEVDEGLVSTKWWLEGWETSFTSS